MDDIKTVVKDLHRIADAEERIAKALEKQNRTINSSQGMTTEADDGKET